MALFVATGKGKDLNSSLAAQQAIVTCVEQLAGRHPDLIILFASIYHNQSQILAKVREAFPEIPLIGCSSGGEIFNVSSEDHSVGLAVLCGLDVQLSKGGPMDSNSNLAGQIMGQKFRQDIVGLVLVLSDGLTGDGAALVQGLVNHLPFPRMVVGGLASDDMQFEKTYQYFNGQIFSNTAVAAKIAGDFEFGIGVRHGWEPVGLPVRVTRTEGILLREINHVPAIRLYEEYFGEYAQRLKSEALSRLAISYPLGIPGECSSEFLLRAPIAVEADGAIRFTSEVPENTPVRLMMGSVEGALHAAKSAAMEALSQMNSVKPKLALVFSGIARRRLLGRRVNDEIKMVRDVLGADVPMLGFYAFGEYAPYVDQNCCQSTLHNESIVIFTLG